MPLRVLAYIWTFPNTLLGLLLWPLTWFGGGAAIVHGVIELHGPAIQFLLEHLTPLPGGASAMTLGHVVIGRNAGSLAGTRAHERIHVRQYERWGPFFIPAYLGVSLILFIRGRRAYLDNPFEREAYEGTKDK